MRGVTETERSRPDVAPMGRNHGRAAPPGVLTSGTARQRIARRHAKGTARGEKEAGSHIHIFTYILVAA